MNITSREIHDKALELGYSACGIIKTEAMRDYGAMLDKRVKRFPATQPYNSYFTKFSRPDEEEPWAKSIIVCAGRYGKYKIPEELQGRTGKYYLTDYRVIPESKECKAAALFDEFLAQKGVEFKKSTMLGGNTACRYAAVKAGIGIIRRNNFLYTEHGSWVWLESWLIDKDMEYTHKPNLAPCPDGCTKCIDCCATGALAEPYQMNAFACATMLTWGGLPNTLPPENLRAKMKGWLCGCDDCQDCCPMNEGKWTCEEDFPGIDYISKYITLEQLCTLDDETLIAKLSPIFFYVGQDKIWKWKVHALRAMAYQYEPKYLPYIQESLKNENELIREMAKWALEQVESDKQRSRQL